MPSATLPRWLAATTLVLAACADDALETVDDACAGASAPSASWSFPSPPADPSRVVAELSFDAPVTGVAANATVVTTNARVMSVTAESAQRYTVVLTEVTESATVTVSLLPSGGGQTVSSACLPLAAPVETTFEIGPPWKLDTPPAFRTPGGRLPPPYFVERTSTVGFSAFSGTTDRAMIVDFDGDGKEDLVTLPSTALPLNPQFLRNVGTDGETRFEDVTASSGMDTATMSLLVFGDLDGDGDLDAYAGAGFRAPEGHEGVWENVGGGHFEHRGRSGTDAREIPGSAFFHEPAAATLADFDGDGHLDLYVGHWYGSSDAGSVAPTDDVLYKGGGDGTFSKVELPEQLAPMTAQFHPSIPNTVGRAAYGLAAGDYDDDGDLDLFVNNYGAGRPAAGSPPRYWDHNLLWRNEGGLSFVDTASAAGVFATYRGIGGVQMENSPITVREGLITRQYDSPIGGNGFGCQFADFDNDGDLDLIVGTIAHPDYPQSDRTMLHVNQGPPNYTFTEESAERGLEYYEDELHPVMVDIDNDGRLDLSMSRLRGGSKWRMYFQNEANRFEMQTVADTGIDVQRPGPTLWLDGDGDGDLDMFMAKGKGRWFENVVGQARNFLKISLEGLAPRDATGARVTLESSTGTQQRTLTSGEGHYNTQQSRVLTFGLGGDLGAANVRVRWSNGTVTELGHVLANYHLSVSERDGSVRVLAAPRGP